MLWFWRISSSVCWLLYFVMYNACLSLIHPISGLHTNGWMFGNPGISLDLKSKSFSTRSDQAAISPPWCWTATSSVTKMQATNRQLITFWLLRNLLRILDDQSTIGHSCYFLLTIKSSTAQKKPPLKSQMVLIEPRHPFQSVFGIGSRTYIS